MRISTRLTITLLVAAVLPLLIAGVLSLYQAEKALKSLGEQSIYQFAESVATQMELYLATHPEVDLNNAAQLEANADLAEIAVQMYGQEGYTAVFDDQAITHFHPSPALIGEDLHIKAADLPDFLAVIDASLDGTPTGGYYDWKDDPDDPNSPVRAKYMYVVPVRDTPLRVASTTYIDEFSQPVDRLSLQLLLILVVVALAAGIAAVILGRWFSRPIDEMADTAGQIAGGDLTVAPPVNVPGEHGLLATAFAQMTANLSSLIRQVQTMSLNLSSAAGQVMMTQRQHAVNSDQQAAAVTNAGAAVEELTLSSAHIADTARDVVAAAGQTQANAQQGVEVMTDAAHRLERIATGNEAAVTKVRDLGELAREIGTIMDLIEDIATQTKLIAFNASIEASAAGEAGRRFAVVAGEVRHLADSVAQSTEEIRSKVEQIQTTTNELIIASEREGKEIESGLAIGDTMADLLDHIYHSAEQTTLAVQQISFSTQQQRTATEQLLEDLQPLTTSAKIVATGSKETVTVMEDLVVMAQDLQTAIARFKLPEKAPDRAQAG